MKYTDDHIEMTATDYDMTVDEVLRVKSGLGPNDDFYEALERFISGRAIVYENTEEKSLHDGE